LVRALSLQVRGPRFESVCPYHFPSLFLTTLMNYHDDDSAPQIDEDLAPEALKDAGLKESIKAKAKAYRQQQYKEQYRKHKLAVAEQRKADKLQKKSDLAAAKQEAQRIKDAALWQAITTGTKLEAEQEKNLVFRRSDD
jgi:hypothetical protein